MKMNAKQRAYWEGTRAKGRKPYIWRVGVLAWGFPVAITWSIVTAAINGWSQLPFLLVGALVFAPFAGYWFGAYMWRLMETAYLQETA